MLGEARVGRVVVAALRHDAARDAGNEVGERADDHRILTVLGSAERVPTLPEFLETIAGRTPLIVEVKTRFEARAAAPR
jgi:hypothetical protein